jgi:hypothetical protein
MHERTPTDAELAPFCRHLGSKKSYFLSRPPRDEAELLDASQACWCRLTQQALGPDGEIVDPRDCRAGRACHEPVL